MKIYKIIAGLLVPAMAISLAACKPGGQQASSDDGKIEIPVWPTYGTTDATSAPESAVTSAPSAPSGSASSPSSEEPVVTSNYTDYTTNSENAPDINKITATIIPNYFTSSQTKFDVVISNRTGWLVGYKNNYLIQKRDGDNWVTLEFSQEMNEKLAYSLDTGRDGLLEIDLSRLTEKPGLGTYRVVIDTICNGYPGSFVKYAVFSIK